MFKRQVEIKTVPEYFRGQCIFITGATGFIGKVLIEKLLRSCPDLKSIYILLREKRGKSPQERIKELTNLPLFQKIRQQDERLLSKIIPVYGDVRKLNLGIREDDKAILISKVNIVYHCAASVRFNDHLNDAIIINVRGTREVLNLAKQFKQLNVYIHLSTTFCNIDKDVIEEKIYPALSDWRDAISIAENIHCKDNTLEVMTLKYIHPFPNTYTYTKSLAEHAVEDMCKGSIPTIIYRPSIVMATCNEPFAGWLDNFNGPFGLATAGLKGVYTHFYGDAENFLDQVYVDNVAKSLIVAAWEKAKTKTDNNEITVYNASGDVEWMVSYFRLFASRLAFDVPHVNRIWYGGDASFTKCWYFFYLRFVLFSLMPTLLLAGLLKLVGKKFLLLQFQRRIYIGNQELSYFLSHSWIFKNDKYKELDKKLLENDKWVFNFDNVGPKTVEDLYQYSLKCVQGTQKFLLNEAPPTATTFNNTLRLYLLDRAVRFTFYGLVLYWVFWKCDIISVIIRKVANF